MSKTAIVALLALATSSPSASASAADWEGTWAPKASECPAGADLGDAAFRLARDRVEHRDYACRVKVERGRDGDDLLVETCVGGGGFLPTFDVVGVHGGRLVVTPLSGRRREYERCVGTVPTSASQPGQVPNPLR